MKVRPGFLFLSLFLLALRPAPAQELHFPADRPLDLRHLELRASVDLPEKTLRGRATLRMTALRTTRVVRLDAVDLEISGVELARGANAEVARIGHFYDAKQLVIELDQPLAPGEAFTVRVDYTCRDPEAGLHFFGPTKAEPEVPYQVWSQGETGSTRSWVPLIDAPNERFTSEMVITVKQGLKVLSNGRKVSVTQNAGDTATWDWRQETDHAAYLLTLVVGTFAITRDTWRGRPVEYWVPPDRAADTARSFASTPRMLDFFSDEIGVDYPWAKYAQVVVEQFTHGGMENTSATTLNERTLHGVRAHLDYRSDGLVSHELAHQWFGDLLTCSDWAHVWLNEGFASYFEALWTEHAFGRDEFLYNMLLKLRGALAGGTKLPIVYRAYPGPWQQFDARAYPKGAWVLHMIRSRLGEKEWRRAMRAYVTAYAHRSVETADFRRSLERTTGRSLGRFFYDWTERPGHPVLEVRHRWDAGQKAMEVVLRQTQTGEAFFFPLRIEYRFAKAQPPLAVTQAVDAKRIRFFVPMAERPKLVRVDPDFTILMDLKENKGRDLWLAQLIHDPGAIARIRAAEHFGASKRPADRKALGQALGHEPFWAVQAEIAKALGKSGGAASRDILLQALRLENPKARRAVVDALGKFRDDATVAEALGALAKKGDPSSTVEAAAIAAWAGLHPAGALDALGGMLARRSHNEGIRQAVLRGIGSQLDPAATGLLIDWTTRGRPRVCRRAALDALQMLARSGTLDRPLTTRVVQALQLCLKPSEDQRIKTAATTTLRALGKGAAPALDTLEALAVHDPVESVRKQAREAADAIRAGLPPHLQLQRLQAELAKLRAKDRKLEERLEKLERKRPEDLR